MANFDELSRDYKDILDKDLRLSGEKTEYFAEVKAKYVKDYMKDGFLGRILDYGCGIGLVSKSLREHFDRPQVEIRGYDISADSIRQARKDVSGVAFTDSFNEIEKEKFDVIIMANVLHHTEASKRPGLIKSLRAMLNSGGKIFVFEHNPYNPLTRLVVKLSVIDKGADLLRLGDLIRLLEDADMRICERRYITFFPRALKALRSLEPALGLLPLGAQYMCVAGCK